MEMGMGSGQMLLSPFLIILIHFANITTAQVPDFRYSYCTPGANYTRNSTYQRNLNTVLSHLPSNTSTNYGFYNTSAGQGLDTVNTIALCRGNISRDSCRDCISDATSKLREVCPNQKEAFGGYDECMLRYSNASIFRSVDQGITFFLYNENNVTSLREFNDALRNLTDKLLADATAGGSLRKLIATGNITGLHSQIHHQRNLSPPPSPIPGTSKSPPPPGIEILEGEAPAPDMIYNHCTASANYTRNSAYRRNLQTILSDLPSNTSNNYGFYNTSAGQDPDTVNTIALCRGDISKETCRGCIFDATRKLREVCPNQKEAFGGYDKCMLRYSDASIFREGQDATLVLLLNSQNVSNFEKFYPALINLTGMLQKEAAAGGSLRKFSTGKITVTGPDSLTIYGLMQCTPDLSEEQCYKCLAVTTEQILKSIHKKQGGRVFGPRCNLIYDTISFYDEIPGISLPSQPPPPPGLRAFPMKTVIGLLAGGVSMVWLGIGFIIYFYSRKSSMSELLLFWKSRSKNDKHIEAMITQYGFSTPRRYKYLEIKRMTNSFKDELGKGGFGSVFKGKLADGSLVAVKVLKESKGSSEEFINEVASIGRTCHVNIVALLGFCYEGKKRALVYEFMCNGSLEKFIYHNIPTEGPQHLRLEKLYEIAVGISRGLEYLHRGCNTRILHFDIKPHNILLDEDFCPKISDFGLAKLHSRKESIISMKEARGTIGYIAPEVYNRNFGGVSHKSDVYSYGMMVLEMVGRRKNIDVKVMESSKIYFPQWIYKQIELDKDVIQLQEGPMSMVENEIARKMIIVGLWCIQTNPSQRPSMDKVIEMLEGSMEDLDIPPNPFFSSPPLSPMTSSTSHHTGKYIP